MHKTLSSRTPSGSIGSDGPAVAALLAAVLAWGCDQGGREHPADLDSGVTDADADTDADVDTDTGTESDWRFGDAGDFWDDGIVEIDGPCADDCSYVYELANIEDGHVRGQSRFELDPGTAGQVNAMGVDDYYVVFWQSQNSWSYDLYRQRLISNWTLKGSGHDLISVDATVYNLWGHAERLKRYQISWNAGDGLLSATTTAGGRTWTKTVEAQAAPLVMWNLREFPLEGFGSSSSLFAFLLGDRYDWDAGGTQWIEVYSPETERLDRVAVSEAQDDDTLILRYPLDLDLPPYESGDLTYDRNAVEIEYAYGIPVCFGSREHHELKVVSAPAAELNLAVLEPGTAVAAPAPLGGYDSAEVAVTGDVTLAGVVDDPTGAGPHPAVVMLPGWDHVTRLGEVGAVDLFAQLADRLAAAGYLVMRLDARGSGGSGGALEDALLDELIDDGIAAVETVRELSESDDDRIFVLARGQGARVAAAVAADAGATVAGAILLAPLAGDFVADADEIRAWYLDSFDFREQCVIAKRFDEMNIVESLEDGSYAGDWFRGHSVAAWQSLFDTDWIGSPIALPPVLLLHGAEDILVDDASVADLAEALAGAGTDVTLAKFDGLSHALTSGTRDDGWPEHGSAEGIAEAAVDALVDWLDDQTGGDL